MADPTTPASQAPVEFRVNDHALRGHFHCSFKHIVRTLVGPELRRSFANQAEVKALAVQRRRLACTAVD
jgi:hypothetical protein